MKRILTFLFRNRTSKNALWLISGKVAQMIISLFVTILTARYLGPANYGLINYASAYTSFFLAFCGLGINSIIVKEFIDYENENEKVIGTSLALRGISSFFSAILIFIVVFIIDNSEPTTIIVVVLSSISLLFNIFETFAYWFQSKLKSKYSAIATFIGYFVCAGYKIYLLISGKSVEYFALATSIDYLIVAVVLIIFYKINGGKRVSFSWEIGKKLLKDGAPFIISGVMVAIYNQTDKIMLKQIIDETENGYYSIANSITTMWCFVLTAIIDSLYPSIMRANKDGNERKFNSLNKMLYTIVFYSCVTASLFITFFSAPIIRILYGEAYLPAVSTLQVLNWMTIFSYWGVARNAWIVAKNKQKYLTYVYLISAGVNIILNFVFIPGLGSFGAAIATLIAQATTTVIAPFFIPALRQNSIMLISSISPFYLIKKEKDSE